jgi:hypothetical protein
MILMKPLDILKVYRWTHEIVKLKELNLCKHKTETIIILIFKFLISNS